MMADQENNRRLLQVIQPAARRLYDFGLAKPSLNTMPDAYTEYRYVRNKRLVAFVRRSVVPPAPRSQC